ncbi:hypothetical protein [Streptomyces sp. NPDC054849]
MTANLLLIGGAARFLMSAIEQARTRQQRPSADDRDEQTPGAR